MGNRIEGVEYRIEKDTVGLKVKRKPRIDEVAVSFGVVLVQFGRAMGDTGLLQPCIGDEIHGKDFLPEISYVEFGFQNRFVQTLQLCEGEMLG